MPNKNTSFSEKLKKSFLLNVVVIAAICIVLYFTFFTIIGVFTGHGQEVKVPMLIGKNLFNATKELSSKNFDIQIDSTYDPNQKPLTILGQQPESGEIVKPGRTIFLTVNKIEPPFTPMPNLNGLSFRSAQMILNSSKLKLGDTSLRPDIAKGAIIEQLYNGEVIRPGQMIPQGSKINLVIGDGLGVSVFDVPDLIGLSYAEAIAMLSAINLQFTAISTYEITDTANAIIYKQDPSAINELGTTNRLREGDEVHFYYMQNPTENDMQRGPSGTPISTEEF